MSGGGLLSRLLTGPLQELSPLMALSDSTPPLDGLLAQDNGLMSLSPTDSLSMTSILPSLPKGYLSGVAVAGARYASADVIAQVGALNFACPSEETENKERSTTSSPESTDHSARSATSPPERGCTESAQRTEDSPPPPEDQHNDDTHDKKWALLLAAFSVRRAVMFGVFGAGYAAGPGFLLITKLYPTIASPLAAALLDGLIVSPLVFFPCFYLCKELILGRSGTSQGGRAETAAGSVGQVGRVYVKVESMCEELARRSVNATAHPRLHQPLNFDHFRYSLGPRPGLGGQDLRNKTVVALVSQLGVH